MENNNIEVEIAYLTEELQVLLTIQLNQAATVQQAIECSGILKRFPEINLNQCPVGIFHKRVSLDAQLEDGDRIEIYRALVIDPKAKRRIKESLDRNKKKAKSLS